MAEASEPVHVAPQTAAPTVATVPTIETGVSTERDGSSLDIVFPTSFSHACRADSAFMDMGPRAGLSDAQGLESAEAAVKSASLAVAAEAANETSAIAEPEAVIVAPVGEAAVASVEATSLVTDERKTAAGGVEPAEAGNVATMAEASEAAHAAPESAAPTVATLPTIETGAES